MAALAERIPGILGDSMLLTIEKKSLPPDVTVLEIKGRISLGRECQQIEWTVDDLLKNDVRKVILDLAGVNHIDSTGIGIIVMCSGKMKKAGGQLRVAGARGVVDQVLKLTKVDEIVGLHGDTAAAVKSFA
jgi:anti-sigma B factor antagonist